MGSDINSVAELVHAVNLPQILLAVLLGFIAWAIALGMDRLAGTLREVLPSQRLTVFRLHTVGRFLVYLAAAAAVSGALLSPKPQLVMALLGSAAVAIGFALKDVAASFFAGLVLLFDQPFQVGDRVDFRGNYGDIVSIGLRSVRMLTLGHDLVTIPNSVFLTEAVSSGNSGSLSMMVTVVLHISISSNAEKSVEILSEVVATSRYAWLKNGTSITVAEVVGETLVPALALTARCYVVDLQLEKAFATDITLRAAKAFREAHIARYEQAAIEG